MTTAETSRAWGWRHGLVSCAASSMDAGTIVRRTLYCYAHESLVRTLSNLVDVQQTAYLFAVEHGYRLGPLFVEEDNRSGSAMRALVHVAASHSGRAAVAVPHRGHLIALGGPQQWQQLLEELTGHPLVLTSPAP